MISLTNRIFEKIKVERNNQDKKWGEQNHHDLKWNSILGEEFGEVSEVVNELYPAKEKLPEFTIESLQKELIQVAAVVVAWLEEIERRKKG